MLGRTNTGGGGGGGGLNFQVVGNPQPTNPKENTIWIDTDQKITGWIFSATEPENPAEGMVWISTGTSSAVEFNALKKNGIQVYPISAKQYISGASVDVTAQSYQGGKWVSWIVYLYNKGNQYASITGGWERHADNPTTCSVTFNDDSIVTSGRHQVGSAGAAAIAYTINAIDLTEVDYVLAEVSNVSYNSSVQCGVMVSDTQSKFKSYQYNTLSSFIAATAAVSSGTVMVDVSALKGKYYIGVGVTYGTGNGSSQLTCSEIRLVY